MVHVQRLYAHKRERMTGREPRQCGRCWLDKACCICPSEAADVAALFPHRIIIYMHVKEFGRGSNTSSLCQVMLPQSSKVLVASVPEDEEELARELSVRPHQTIVLYPSADSITVSWPPHLASASIARWAVGSSHTCDGMHRIFSCQMSQAYIVCCCL